MRITHPDIRCPQRDDSIREPPIPTGLRAAALHLYSHRCLFAYGRSSPYADTSPADRSYRSMVLRTCDDHLCSVQADHDLSRICETSTIRFKKGWSPSSRSVLSILMIKAIWTRIGLSLSAEGVVPSLILILGIAVVASALLPLMNASDHLVEKAQSLVYGLGFAAYMLLVLAILNPPKPLVDPEVRKMELQNAARATELYFEHLKKVEQQTKEISKGRKDDD